jgi:hypothetical protein
MLEAAESKDIHADMINVGIKALVQARYQLPAFSTLPSGRPESARSGQRAVLLAGWVRRWYPYHPLPEEMGVFG